MSSVVSDTEILNGISSLYEKIEQCNKSKQQLEKQIECERYSKMELSSLIDEEKKRPEGKRPHYDILSLQENMLRCDTNIEMFKNTIQRETDSITNFKYMIDTLQNDLIKPKEIFIDMKSNNSDFRNVIYDKG